MALRHGNVRKRRPIRRPDRALTALGLATALALFGSCGGGEATPLEEEALAGPSVEADPAAQPSAGDVEPTTAEPSSAGLELSPATAELAESLPAALGLPVLVYDLSLSGVVRADLSGDVAVAIEGRRTNLWAASRDGQKVADIPEGAGEIVVYDIATGTTMTHGATEFAGGLFFSPDGRYLAFRDRDGGQRQYIWDLETDQTTELGLPSDGSLASVWDWSRDGQWMVGLIARAESRTQSGWDSIGLFLVRPDGTDFSDLPVSDVLSGIVPVLPFFSPDGASIWMNDQSGAFWAFDLSSQELTQRTMPGDGESDLSQARWWLDDSRLLFMRRPDDPARDSQLWIHDVGAGTETVVFEGRASADFRPITG